MAQIKKDLIEINKKYKLLYFIFAIALLANIVGFTQDFKRTFKYGGMDLRGRVVGARVFKMKSNNPYTFKWNKNIDEKLVDPRDYYFGFKGNRLTITPSLLFLHSLFANLPYKAQRISWTIIQWLLLLFSIFLLLLSIIPARRFLALTISLLIISGSYIWRLHIDRGQIYVLYVFLFSLSYFILINEKKYAIPLSSLFMGLVIALRPTMILIYIPMLLFRKIKLITWISGFLVLFLLLPVFYYGFSIYPQYFAAMKQHSLMHLDKVDWHSELYPKDRKIIDGTKNLSGGEDLPIEDSSLQNLLQKYLHIEMDSNKLVFLLILVMSPLIVLLYKYRKFNNNFFAIFLFAYTLILISDFFLPAARNSYNNVFWLFPIILILGKTKDKILIGFPILILFLTFLLNLFYYINSSLLIFADYLFLIFAVISMTMVLKENHPD